MVNGCFGDSFEDDDPSPGSSHTKKESNVSVYDQLKKMMATLDDETYARMVRDIDAEKKRTKPSLADGAKLYAAMNDNAPRAPRPLGMPEATGDGQDDLGKVARPQDPAAPSVEVGGMRLPSGVSPARIAELLKAASPGDSFQIENGGGASNIDLSK